MLLVGWTGLDGLDRTHGMNNAFDGVFKGGAYLLIYKYGFVWCGIGIGTKQTD
jgi:hypothetical protein